MKNDQKGFSTIEGVVLLVIIAIIGSIGWFVSQRQNDMSNTPDTVLSSISSDAKSTYSNASFEPIHGWNAEASATAFNKVSGYDYAVSGVGKGIWLAYASTGQSKTIPWLWVFHKTIPPANNLDEVKHWVSSRLTLYGFTTSDHQTYKKGSNTCTVLNDPAGLAHNDFGQPSNILEVRCFGQGVAQDAAAQMKPFTEEYIRAHATLRASGLTVGPLTIKSKNGAGVIGSSHAAGYDIAEMVVSTKSKKTLALYYAKNADIRTGSNSGWHYVTEATDEFGFSCDAMKADQDARKALYDQVCLSNAGQVRLDTQNRALQ